MTEAEGDASDQGTAGLPPRDRLWDVGALVLVVVFLAAVAVGLGLLPPGPDSTGTPPTTETPVPTLSAAPTADKTGASSDGATPIESGTPVEATPTTAPGVTVRGDTRQFQFEVLSVASCGRTCRDIDVSLTNAGEAATGVSATSRLYAGERDPSNKVEEVTTTVGDMAAGRSVRRTVTVDPGIQGGLALCNAETVTLVTTVRSDDHSQEFTSHPDIEC